MTVLTRKQVHDVLRAAGWQWWLLDIMTAVAYVESGHRVEVVGPMNSNGTEDLGLLQINSRYVDGRPYWSRELLLSDATYNASCGYQIAYKAAMGAQNLTAWYGYRQPDGSYPYMKYLPPHLGGPELTVGSRGFLVKDLQERLNALGETLTPDGDYGLKTQAAVKRWQTANPCAADGVLRRTDSLRLLS